MGGRWGGEESKEGRRRREEDNFSSEGECPGSEKRGKLNGRGIGVSGQRGDHGWRKRSEIVYSLSNTELYLRIGELP